MANPTKMTTLDPAVISATTSDGWIDIDDSRYYTASHTGLDNAGSASTANIVFEYDAETVTAATAAEGANKLILVPGSSIVVHKNANKLAFKTISGAAVFNLIPMFG